MGGMETLPRIPCQSDVSDEEWDILTPNLILMREDAPRRLHDPCEVSNGLRKIARAGR